MFHQPAGVWAGSSKSVYSLLGKFPCWKAELQLLVQETNLSGWWGGRPRSKLGLFLFPQVCQDKTKGRQETAAWESWPTCWFHFILRGHHQFTSQQELRRRVADVTRCFNFKYLIMFPPLRPGFEIAWKDENFEIAIGRFHQRPAWSP